ncbi:MAG: ABC transporter substrate-binding protein [Chloroflexaceae bacterium]
MQHVYLAALLLAGLLLSACGSGSLLPGSDLSAGEDDVVTIGFAANDHERQRYAPLIESFNADNPDMRVQFVSLDAATGAYQNSNEPMSSDERMRRIAGAADTVALNYVDPMVMERGYLFDLTPLIEADPDFNRDDFYPLALDAAGRDGSLYILPRTLHVQLLAYNQDLWMAQGLPAPDPNWEWSGLIAMAEELATRRSDTVDVYGLVLGGGEVLALLAELGPTGRELLAQPVDEVRLDQPEIAAAIERVVALGESGAIYMPARDENSYDSEQLQQLVQNQRAAMWPEGMFNVGPDMPPLDFAVGKVPFPALPLPFFSGIDEGYMISSGTEHPQEAWRWLRFVSRQEPERNYAGSSTVSSVPARQSVAERTGYWESMDATTAAAVQAALEQTSVPVPSGLADQQVSVFSVLGQALESVLQGEAVDDALAAAQAELDEQIAAVALTPEPTPDTRPIVVATPVPDVAPDGATVVRFNGDIFRAGQLRMLAREFNQNNPDIFVEVIEPDYTSGVEVKYEDFLADIDCFASYGAPPPQIITATLDLQPLIDADASFDINDYPSVFRAPFREGNALHGLPYRVELHMLHYNQTAFDAAGLDYPTIDWTPDDFLNAAQQLTVGSGAEQQYGYAAPGSITEDLRFFLDRFGVALTQGSDESIRPNYTDSEVLAALNYYLDLLRDYSPHEQIEGYSMNSQGPSESASLIHQGRLGMWFDFNFGIGFGGDPGFVHAVAPLPIGDGSLTAGDFNVSGLHINAATEQPEACWTWMKYLSGQVFEMHDQFPARISVATSEEFLSQAEVGAAEVFAAYSEALQETPREATSPNALWQGNIDYYWFYRALDQVLQGEADLEQAMAAAQATTEDYLACLRNDTEAYVCATQVDPEYDGFHQASPEAAPLPR